MIILMSKIDLQSIEYYQELLAKDPQSQAFAALADAYRQMSMLDEAESTARNGIKRHPNLSTGHLVLGKILKDRKKFEEALVSFKTACQMNPENLLAHQLMGEICVDLKLVKEALKAFKMVMFLNPSSEKAKRIIQKLESVTADEYDDEVFEMTQLQSAFKNKLHVIPTLGSSNSETSDQNTSGGLDLHSTEKQTVVLKSGSIPKGLDRMLSLVDAFIVRNDLLKAHSLLRESQTEYGDHSEISQRLRMLDTRSQVSSMDPHETATPLVPLEAREKLIRRKKLDTLYSLLRKIEENQSIPH